MKCYLCKTGRLMKFLDLGMQPLANKYPSSREEVKKEDFYPLRVFFCTKCKNVQLGTMISRERMFLDYYYLSSINPGLVRHFEGMAKELAPARLVVDIGSNDGILLKPLRELGIRAVGVEPSINVSKIANDRGLSTITSFFNNKAVKKIKQNYGKADTVVASSIFTHLEDPHQFITDVKKVMTDDGKFIIEVEYIGNILADVQFERFYLDRIFYYSLTSLDKLFKKHDMRVIDVKKISPHGGSLRVTVCKKRAGFAVLPVVEDILEEEKNTLTAKRLAEFRKTADSYLNAFRNKLEDYKKRGLRVAGYGAPARVATICNYGKIDSSLIEFIIDDSPLKQNRYSPGTHIPIFPQSYLENYKPDVFVVFAYEYFDDIKKKTGGRYKYFIPIPPREAT